MAFEQIAPTYSFMEIRAMIDLLEEREINILRALVQQEKHLYSYEDLIAIYALLMKRTKYLIDNSGK